HHPDPCPAPSLRTARRCRATGHFVASNGRPTPGLAAPSPQARPRLPTIKINQVRTNVAKHARASAAYVDIDVHDDALRLRGREAAAGGRDRRAGRGRIASVDRAGRLAGTLQTASPAAKGPPLLVPLPTAGAYPSPAPGSVLGRRIHHHLSTPPARACS